MELALWAVFAIFEKLHFVIQPRSLLFDTRKSCVFKIFLLRSIKAYLCPNIINFYAVDFSESRPEEVISFFWRSVYIRTQFQDPVRISYTHILTVNALWRVPLDVVPFIVQLPPPPQHTHTHTHMHIDFVPHKVHQNTLLSRAQLKSKCFCSSINKINSTAIRSPKFIADI